MFDNEKNGYWENGSGAGNQSADQDGYVRPESQSADQGGYVRPESQSTDQGGYVRSESQSADQDGYVRTESQNTDQGGYVRSESQSADQQEAYTKRDYRNTSYIPQEREQHGHRKGSRRNYVCCEYSRRTGKGPLYNRKHI